MDRAAGGCDGDAEEEPGEGELAVVHFVLLLCGGAGKLCSALCAAVDGAVCRVESTGTVGVDGGAVFDRDGDYAEHAEGGGGAAAGAGSGALDRGGELIAMGDPCGMDRVVVGTEIIGGSVIPLRLARARGDWGHRDVW